MKIIAKAHLSKPELGIAQIGQLGGVWPIGSD
jgi:hypothetical protein